MAGHKDAMVRILETTLQGNPQSLVFSRLADSYRKRGDIQQAIDVCSAGLENHPSSTTGRIILGRCFLEQEKVEEAVEEFVKVIETDRRNQVAVKMLADIYARQGMKEKAGDLYSYLRTMDPDNDSIITLCANFQGAGCVNIYEIVGLSPRGSDVSPEPEAGPFAQTMQFDAEELKAAPSVELYAVDEIVSDGAPSGSDEVTGDDISSRMSMMFEEGAERPIEPVDAQIPIEIAEEPHARDENAAGPLDEASDIAENHEEVSGSDISSRIEQLFGEVQSEIPAHIEESEETDVSGDDVVSRMAQLFEVSGKAETALEEDKNDAIADISEEIAQSIDDAIEQSAALTSELSDEPALNAPDATGLEDNRISGDEVAARLETIFEEEESPQEAPSAHFGVEEMPAEPIPESPVEMSDDLVSEARELPREPAAVSEETFEDTLTLEEHSEMSGDDIVARLTEIFPDNLLPQDTLSMVDSIADDDKEAADVNEGFYTMSGENAQTAQSEETLLEKLDDVEIEVPVQGDEAAGMVMDEQPVERADGEAGSSQAAFDPTGSIPDHVLTPTLADIYFQQGQSRLAVQIYTRLLQRDPDNEKIARRLEEITTSIASGLAPLPPEEKGIPTGSTVPNVFPTPPKRTRAAKGKSGGKPLSGVRIKKNIKKKRS
jgi:tetratricopeptide (TPR) repeat protein